MSPDTKRILLRVTVCILAAAGAYTAGRYTAPAKVVTVDRETVRTVEDTHAREQVRELTAQLETLRAHREVTIVTRPDGTREEHRIEDTDRRTDTRTDTKHDTETEKHAETVREVTHTVTVERDRPAWHVSALAGLDGPAALHGNLTPIYGASVERRLFGPFSAGVWGLSSGAAGVSLSIEF